MYTRSSNNLILLNVVLLQHWWDKKKDWFLVGTILSTSVWIFPGTPFSFLILKMFMLG